MSGFPILDLVVGVIFIFFLLSIICSSIVEMILTAKRIRAQVLGKWLLTIFDTEIINEKNEKVLLGQEIMDHCALTALSPTHKAPAYIDAKNFVAAALDKITAYSKVINPKSIDDIIQSLESTTAISDELKRAFLIYANEAKDTFEALSVKTMGAIEMFRKKVENWYDSNMDRISGTMKVKYTRRFTFISAIVITLLLNADTIEISKYLYSNPDARAKVVAKAYETSTDETMKEDMNRIRQRATALDDTTKLTIDQLNDSLKAKINVINEANAALKESIPIGWAKSEFAAQKDGADWVAFVLTKLVGMAVTVIAIMMGAPFWFDVLNKISNIRGNGNKPSESEKKT
ncbi:MAG TPA: hypothetical protein VH396_18105 [Chitinophagaceae bacterium]